MITEIGTLHGGTLWTWCKLAAPDGLIVSIDLPGGAFGGGYANGATDLLRTFRRKNQTLELIRDDSHEPRTRARLESALAGRAIDFLFIDGDHTYDGVKRDFEMYSPLVARGGLVAFHDILEHPGDPECQVNLLWNELRSTMEHIELLDTADVRARGRWGGIGVVFMT